MSSIHTIALSTPVTPPIGVIAKLRASQKRFTAQGEVIPTWREYSALCFTFALSLCMLVLTIVYNWADRQYGLERVLDGAGVFGLVSGVLLAILSRRLDFGDLVAIIIRKKRYLDRYSELLELLEVTEGELKSALTFEGVKVPPIARDCTSYSFQVHDGVLNPFSGLDTRARDTNIIVGNMTALARGASTVRYFTVTKQEGVIYLKERDDAMFRIVTEGYDKIVK